jgi:multicomponent Na+:H+ antiporter subunit B
VTLRRVSPELVTDLAESVGAASYVAVGLLGVAAGTAFLANVLPLGQPGELLSEFLEQTLVIRRPGEVT